jgi:dUTPase
MLVHHQPAPSHLGMEQAETAYRRLHAINGHGTIAISARGLDLTEVRSVLPNWDKRVNTYFVDKRICEVAVVKHQLSLPGCAPDHSI